VEVKILDEGGTKEIYWT